jgi:hypothetical protein
LKNVPQPSFIVFLCKFLFYYLFLLTFFGYYRKMVQPLELHGMTDLEFCEKLILKSDEEFEAWMAGLGLINGSKACDHCQEPMRDRTQNRYRYWICENIGCRYGPTNQNKPTKGF